jgi:hypothetical protein
VKWILLDLAIAFAALGLLAVLVLSLYRKVKALSRAVGTAGETVAVASDALAAAQSAGPLGAPRAAGAPLSDGPRRASGA